MSRNLVEYPVTVAEISECCRRYSEVASQSECIGDLSPLLLHMAANIVEAAGGMLDGIEERMKKNHGDWLAYATPWDRATALVHAFQAVKPATDMKDDQK